MRITGGTHRGRILASPTGDTVRPTADRARLAMFNMLESRGLLRDAAVMDVCCGTGALGLESLSRGAASAIFIDQAATSLTLAKQNAQALKLAPHCHFIQADAQTLPPRAGTMPSGTLVFLDPPYRQNLVLPILSSLRQGAWIAPGTTMVVEVENEYQPIWPDGLAVLTTKTYGVAGVYLLEVIT
jgi:16S rRNA (guanine966-N2)-methyltransferase